MRAIVISMDRELSATLGTLAGDSGRLRILKMVEGCPGAAGISNLFGVHTPDVALIGVGAMSEAVAVARMIERTAPGTPVLACGRTFDSTTLLPLMRAGVRDFLPFPFQREQLDAAVSRIANRVEQTAPPKPSAGRVISFLPAKGGVGASTIAANTSTALARRFQVSALLADFDLDCGMIAFLLNLNAGLPVTDAGARVRSLDEKPWSSLAIRCGRLDVLPAARIERPGVDLDVAGLLAYARSRYGIVCADLPANLEPHTETVIAESDRIYLVCTPELSSMHLARRKKAALEGMHAAGRVEVLLNRCDRRGISVTEVERMLGLRVHLTLPNDYVALQAATAKGLPVSTDTELGRRFGTLAESLAGDEAERAPIRRGFAHLAFQSFIRRMSGRTSFSGAEPE